MRASLLSLDPSNGWCCAFLTLMPFELITSAVLDGLIAIKIILAPYILQWFIREQAWLPAAALIGLGLIKSILWNWTSCLNCRIVVMIQSSLSAAMMERALSAPVRVIKLIHPQDPALAVAILNKDTSKLKVFISYLNMLWIGPIEICVVFALLIRRLGWPGLAGVGIIVAYGPLQVYILARLHQLRRVRGKLEVLEGGSAERRANSGAAPRRRLHGDYPSV